MYTFCCKIRSEPPEHQNECLNDNLLSEHSYERTLKDLADLADLSILTLNSDKFAKSA